MSKEELGMYCKMIIQLVRKAGGKADYMPRTSSTRAGIPTDFNPKDRTHFGLLAVWVPEDDEDGK